MRSVGLLALAAVLMGAQGAAAEIAAGTSRATLTVDGLERSFLIHVGASAPGDTPLPVVFMFHGLGGDGARIRDISDWDRIADREGFIAVFPDALPHCVLIDMNDDGDFSDAGEARIATSWAAGFYLPRVVQMPCPDGLPAPLPRVGDRPVPADDLIFVDAIVAHLRASLRVDPQRIFAAGFSNGAQMASRIAFQRGDVFAAVAAHEGALGPTAPRGRPVPFVVTYGSRDAFATAFAGLDELPLTPAVLAIFRSQVDTILAQFGLAPDFETETGTAGDHPVVAFTFDTTAAGGPAAAPFTFAVLGGLGHAYPDGANYPFPMADYLWSFFRRHPLP